MCVFIFITGQFVQWKMKIGQLHFSLCLKLCEMLKGSLAYKRVYIVGNAYLPFSFQDTSRKRDPLLSNSNVTTSPKRDEYGLNSDLEVC